MDLPYKAETLYTIDRTSTSSSTVVHGTGPIARDLTENVPEPSRGLLLLGVVLLLIIGLPLKSKPHG